MPKTPKKSLPPAVLAALGLSACVDGCDPGALPIVGDWFDQGGDTDIQPCLTVEIPPCLSVIAPQPVSPEPPVGPCLKVARPTPVIQPVPVGPCLELAPDPKPQVMPCLDFAEPEPVRVGPCLRVARPRPPKGKCLSKIEPPVQPCLSPPPAPPPPPTIPEAEQEGRVPSPVQDVVAALIEEGVLPDDVRERLTRGES